MTRALLFFFLNILIFKGNCLAQASTHELNDTHIQKLAAKLHDHLTCIHPFQSLSTGIESIFRDYFRKHLEQQAIDLEEKDPSHVHESNRIDLIRALKHRSDFRIIAVELTKSKINHHLKIYLALTKIQLLEYLKHYQQYITTLIKRHGLNISSIELSTSRPEPLTHVEYAITSKDNNTTFSLSVHSRYTTQSALSKEVSTFIRHYYRRHRPHLVRRLNILIHYKEGQAEIHVIISFKKPIGIGNTPAKIGFNSRQ